MSAPLRALPEALVRGRRWILPLWLLLAVALGAPARRAERVLEVGARIHGSESAHVEHILKTRFASPFAHWAVLVVTGAPAPDVPAGRALLAGVVEDVAAVPGVTRTISWLEAADPLFTPSGGTFVVVGLDPGMETVDALIPRLRAATAAAGERLRAEHPSLALRWTGEAALNFDLRRTSGEQVRRAELRILPITLLLLLLAFGAIVAAAVPVLTGFLAIPIALGGAVLWAEQSALSILLVNVVSMIGLGLGIDYGLLMVSRFREALAAGSSGEEAAVLAARHAGHTILLSGAAVAIGFAALLLVPLNELRSVAVGGLLVVTTSVLLATTFLPGILAFLGNRVDAGQLTRWRVPQQPSDGWRRWGRWVASHPKRVLIVAGIPVVLLGWQARRAETILPRGDWLPAQMESAHALRDLQAMGRAGVVYTIRVVLELPAGSTAAQPETWLATRRLADRLAADPRIARVQSLSTLTGSAAPDAYLLSLVPAAVLTAFVSQDAGSTLLEVVPHEGVEPGELLRLARELRRLDAADAADLAGARIRVGGLPALNADYEDTLDGWLPILVAFVVSATFLALAAGFRSLLIPLKALVLNLVSVVGAFGAVVLVFQDGYGAGLLGIMPLHGIFPLIPMLVFCTVFGLSMDYEVFLVARIAEARRAGLDETEALAEGLARTGRVITSAAAIMVAVFAAFTLGDFLLIRMLGFALAAAVLIDVTLVRMAIGPALLVLAGRWNWWPGDRVRNRGPAAAHEVRGVGDTTLQGVR